MTALRTFTLCLGILLSQFYLIQSGLPQISDFIFLLLFFLTLPKLKHIPIYPRKALYIIFLFFLYVLTSNLFWSLIEENIKFNLFSIYLIYNILIFYSISTLFAHNLIKKETISAALAASILVLFFQWVFGLGRQIILPRYNGYFNDPNQMAFWILCCYASYVLLTDGKFLTKTLLFFACIALVFSSMSRSALIGISIIFIGTTLNLLKHSRKKGIDKIIGIALFPIFIGLTVIYINRSDSSQATIERLTSTNFQEQADVRGYDRITQHPKYLIFGAGQGGDERFGTGLEIHSTWAAFFFYYGIVGLLLFFAFILKIALRLNIDQLIIFFGPLAYSFSTFGARTPIFWIFLGCSLYAASQNNKKNLLEKNALYNASS